MTQLITQVDADRPASIPEAEQPDWNSVPFEVHCARCGQDLRGSQCPECPACHLEFSWDEAVPLEHLQCAECGYHLRGLKETRCPECGLGFSWKEAIEQYHSRRKLLFEYHWRSKPVRSFLFSCRLAMRPRKLWETINIHDPPNGRGLVMLALCSLVAFVLSVGALLFSNMVIANLRYAMMIMRGSGQVWGNWDLFAPYTFRFIFAHSELPIGTMAFVLWALSGFGALLVLRQSMRSCQVRTGHVLRVCTYALIPAAVLLFTFFFLMAVFDWTEAFGWNLRWDAVPWMCVVALSLMWLGAMRRLAMAYRRYIRMRHVWAVVVLTQIVAVLFTGTAMTLLGLSGWL